jgi:hypothetical protein
MRRSLSGVLELIFVTALLALFGAASFMLVSAGNGSYQRIMDKRAVSGDLRVALSYLATQFRQNDEAGAVSLRPCPEGGEMLVFTRVIEGTPYETRIYLASGRLMEAAVAADTPFGTLAGTEVVPLTGWRVSFIEPAGGAGRLAMLSVSAGEGVFAETYETAVRLNAAEGKP